MENGPASNGPMGTGVNRMNCSDDQCGLCHNAIGFIQLKPMKDMLGSVLGWHSF